MLAFTFSVLSGPAGFVLAVICGRDGWGGLIPLAYCVALSSSELVAIVSRLLASTRRDRWLATFAIVIPALWAVAIILLVAAIVHDVG